MPRSRKVALVTGASAGIGKAVAERLVDESYTVYAAARRLNRMDDLKALGARPLGMDITREEQITAAVETIHREAGGIDILVNNAGFGLYGAVEDTSIDDARYQFEVNMFGLARLTQLALPHMREQRFGTIFNITSVGGRLHTPLGAWYHATKFALEGWSDALRLEVASFGIDVVVIRPGAILTEFGDVSTAPMIERSGNSAYAPMARSMERTFQHAFRTNFGSPPQVIADVISKALKTKRPKTRYAAGKHAKALLATRALLSDRSFDRVVQRFVLK